MRISDWSSDVCSSDLHIADFVEKERAARRLLETPRIAAVRAGKRALFVPEQLRFDQLARDRRHVDRDERPVPAQPGRVDRARDDFLAGARFRSEEHTSELQSLMRISYAVLCLKKKKTTLE